MAVLSPFEIESMIDSLSPMQLNHVGSDKFVSIFSFIAWSDSYSMKMDEASKSPWEIKGAGKFQIGYFDFQQIKLFKACRDALSRHDELVIDTFINTDKVKELVAITFILNEKSVQLSVVVHRLITLESWRQNIIPILSPSIDEMTSMKIYLLVRK